MVTSNKPVMEIIIVFYSPVYARLFADFLKVSYIYNLKFNNLAEYSLRSTRSTSTYIFFVKVCSGRTSV
jgi:hypothetical protein